MESSELNKDDLLSEIQRIVNYKYGSALLSNRTPSTLERAANEIMRLQIINEELRAEIATLQSYAKY
jgi:hypothetical protein